MILTQLCRIAAHLEAPPKQRPIPPRQGEKDREASERGKKA